SDGTTIWDRNHEVMPNGTGLNSSGTCTQAALFTPYPGHDSLYYLFTPPDMFNTQGSFCYSIVDMTLNNGYGDITEKNIPLFSPSTEKVTAVQARNKDDIWVIGHGFNNADFYVFRIDTNGIDPIPVISTVGMPHEGSDENNIGMLKASPCGDKLALAVLDSAFVELFDFDDATGIVSNPIHLGDYTQNNAWGLYGVEFSPNGSRLYVTQEFPGVLVQYDLLAGSPAAIILSADTIATTGPFEKFGALQNGPDGRIYIAKLLDAELDRINHPDSLGSACGYELHAIDLPPFHCGHGLPNFMSSLFCAASFSTGLASPICANTGVSIFPNPGSDHVSVRFSSVVAERITLQDCMGRIIHDHLVEASLREFQLDISPLASVIYLLKVHTAGGTLVDQVVKQ
ncbi:MAG: T9SS type A sorting domain-containing protein, partial [Bacteroidota bacterium]|nr:T9SS type A sorting domain-containing protein [Bacteroidota bacterium]